VADEEVLNAGNRRFAEALENDAAWLLAEKDRSATDLKKRP